MRFAALLIVISYFFLGISERSYKAPLRSAFGVKVSYQASGAMLTFIAYQTDGYNIRNKKYMTFEDWVKCCSGFWPSIYNPERIDLFVLNNLDCGVGLDTNTLKEYCYCGSVDSLWKLRFYQYPFRGRNEDGWSGKEFKPSSEQEIYLYKRYGIRSIDSDFFQDTSIWMILHDVENLDWIGHYKSLK